MNAVRMLLIALALLSLAAPAAAAAQDCTKCHTCTTPTATQPCLSDCPREGNHQPSYADFTAMDLPDSCVLDQLVDRYDPVIFNHAQHAKMSGMGGASCRLCHHANEEGWVGNCYGCHPEHLSGAQVGVPDLKTAYHRQCMFCHRDWSHETNCEICHAVRGTGGVTKPPSKSSLEAMHGFRHREEPKVVNFKTSYAPAPYVSFDHATHTETHGLSCMDCHSNDSCTSCHDSGGARFSPRLHDYSNLNICTQCHNVGHCSTCHAQAKGRKFDHAFTGMSLKGYHSSLSCERCHQDKLTHGYLPRECGGCHVEWAHSSYDPTGFDHAAKVGVDLMDFHEGLACTDCHLDGDFNRSPDCHGCHEDKSPRDLR